MTYSVDFDRRALEVQEKQLQRGLSKNRRLQLESSVKQLRLKIELAEALERKLFAGRKKCPICKKYLIEESKEFCMECVAQILKDNYQQAYELAVSLRNNKQHKADE